MKKVITFDEKNDDGTVLKGIVEFEHMKNSDRLKYLDGTSIDLKTGQVKQELTFSADLMNLAAARISTVKLDYDGQKITKKNDLEYYPFGVQVLSKVAVEILQGPTFPKKS